MAVRSAMKRSRSSALRPAGTATGTTPTSLPSSVPVARREIGTDTTSAGGRSPRSVRYCRSAPETADSTTSLTVASLRRRAVRSQSTTRTWRRKLVGWVMDVGASLPVPGERSSRRPASASRRSGSANRSLRSNSPSRGGGTGAGGSGRGTPSAKAASTASPPMPSASTWCTTRITAMRSPGRVTQPNRHNGQSGGRRAQTSSARTSSSSPTTCVTDGSKPGMSCQ